MKHLDHKAAAILLKTLRDLVNNNSEALYVEEIREKGRKKVTDTLRVKTTDMDIERLAGERQDILIGLSSYKVAQVPVTRAGYVPDAINLAARYEVKGKVVRFHGKGGGKTIKLTFTFY